MACRLGRSDHQRDELLRKLIWTVVVRTSGDDDREIMGLMIRPAKELCCGLAGSVRAVRIQRALLSEDAGIA